MLHEVVKLSGESNATLTTYVADLSDKYPRKALLILPGGGYNHVCVEREGEPIANAFMPYGFNAFILNYTVDGSKIFPNHLIEVACAIKHIKDNAERYSIDPDKVFVMGFSAGGHLAASAGTMWKMKEIYDAVDMPYGYNKPRGVVLSYAVISPEYENHFDSFRNMWGTESPSEEQLAKANIVTHIDADSAPAFIWHTFNDDNVDVRNALDAVRAYVEAGVSCEFHMFPDGPHGISVANEVVSRVHSDLENKTVAQWVPLCANWFEDQCK